MPSPRVWQKPGLLLLFVLVFTAFTVPARSESGTSKPEISIRNFGKVNDNYYRGGQPRVSEFKQLKRLGVKLVIDLQKGRRIEEESWVVNAGMNYVNIPLSTTRPATAEQTQFFLKLVNDPDNWPVYVHCARGKHRTGEMTAIYRLTHDLWTADLAYREMKFFGYYSFPNHGSLKDYVYEYYRNQRSREPAPKESVGAPELIPVHD